MTKRLGDIRLPYCHFERKREIFAIRGQAVDVRESQTGNLLPVDLQASPYIKSAKAAYRSMAGPEPFGLDDLLS